MLTEKKKKLEKMTENKNCVLQYDGKKNQLKNRFN